MDRDFLIDLFSDFGPVTIRRMFSGFGISADGTNFALALRAGLYFRADEPSIPQFEAEGSKPFQYQTRAKTVTVELVLAIAGAAVRRSGGTGGVGEGGIGGGAARGVAQAAKGEAKAVAKKARQRSRHPKKKISRSKSGPRSMPTIRDNESGHDGETAQVRFPTMRLTSYCRYRPPGSGSRR